MKHRIKAIAVLAAALAFAASPFLTSDFNGFSADLFPIPQINPPVQPAGYAFGIWGLIYAWLLVHAVWGVFHRADATDWDAARLPLTISLVVGAAWLPVAAISVPGATVLIWVMLVSAIMALFATPRRDRWLAQAPIAIYAGWLSAASWVSIGLMLGGYGIMAEEMAALVSLLLATAFAVAVQLTLGRAVEYGITVIWALVGVVLANLGAFPIVAGVAVFGILAVATVLTRLARRGDLEFSDRS